MKLSEKLAALEEQDRQVAAAAAPAPNRVASAIAPPKTRRQSASRQASKRKVRDLVLAELAPKMGAGLHGETLATEVRAALDRILQREDVKVSPLERRRFLQEM